MVRLKVSVSVKLMLRFRVGFRVGVQLIVGSRVRFKSRVTLTLTFIQTLNLTSP